MNKTHIPTAFEIRVVAPSQSNSNNASKRMRYERAKERLEELGYYVSFGEHVSEQYHLGTAEAKARAEDFNAAFADKRVRAVMALNGGWSANEVLPYIDWEVIRANPKPFVGFSDNTVLQNALYAMTGQVSFLGPNFGTIGGSSLWEYSLEHLHQLLQGQMPLQIEPSKRWRAHGLKRSRKAAPWKAIQTGAAQGVLIGGNLGTFYLLQGTQYQPVFDKPYILAAEDDAESGKYTPYEFSRRLESILQLPGARQHLQGVLIGRFEPASRMTLPLQESIIVSKQLGNIPVICNVDFGHTYPMASLPIGGAVNITAGDTISIELLEY